MKIIPYRGNNRRLAGAFSSGATTAAFMNQNVPTPVPTYEPVTTQIVSDTSGVPASSLTSPTSSGLMASTSGEASQLSTASQSGTVYNSSGGVSTIPTAGISSILSSIFGTGKTSTAGVSSGLSNSSAMSPLMLLVMAGAAVYLISRKS
jgi:hypothetical protein